MRDRLVFRIVLASALGAAACVPVGEGEQQDSVSSGLAAGQTVRVSAIVAENSGMCVDVHGNSSAPGFGLEQYACNKSAAQTFALVGRTDGNVTIETSHQLCLDSNGGGTVVQDTCSGSAAQAWSLVAQSDASYLVENAANHGCLNVDGAGSTSRERLITYSCTGAPKNERFKIAGLSSTPPPTQTPPPTIIPIAPTALDISLTSYAISPTTAKAGDTIAVRALYTAKVAGTYVVDMELRNAANASVLTHKLSQSFLTDETKELDWSFVVPQGEAAGQYWVTVASFNPTYSVTYFWKQWVLTLTTPDAPLPAKPLPSGGAVSGTFAMGVNADGMEASGKVIPGVAGTNYALISNTELDTYHARGLGLVRIPLSWNRMQPTVGGPLNSAYVAQLQGIIAHAGTNGQKVIVDIHAYGGRDGHQLNDGTLTSADLADLWSKLAGELKGLAGLGGYDLMNEPHGMPTQTAWAEAAQAAIDAIRLVDTATLIYAEGNGWSTAAGWNAQNVTFPLSDPANKIVYSAHAYGDRDASGTHFTWAAEAAAGVTTDTLTSRITPFAEWCEAYKVPCHIGEIGVGNDDANWNVQLDKALGYAKQHGLQVTYWAAGPWWGSYPMSIENDSAPQLSIIEKYSK